MDWFMPQDKLSAHVGINHRIRLLRLEGKVPTLIRLGKEHTKLFLKECWLTHIPSKKPERWIPNSLIWDDDNNRLCYWSNKRMIPILFNDTSIYGIGLEGEPKPRKRKPTS